VENKQVWRISNFLHFTESLDDTQVTRKYPDLALKHANPDPLVFACSHIFNDIPVDLPVSSAIMASWSPLWQETSAKFNVKLKQDLNLAHLCGKMFFVWEEDHQLTAWWRHINNNHADEKSWHVSVNCIMVDPRGCTGVFLNVMSDIN
jgi:hypothetical protein